MAVAERIRPYVEQLFENPDVHAELQRAAARARQAYRGANAKKSKQQALADKRVQLRVAQAAAAIRDAAVAGRRGRREQERQERARRQRRITMALVMSAGALFFAAKRQRASAADADDPARR